jgi:hypothetical protein
MRGDGLILLALGLWCIAMGLAAALACWRLWRKR